MDMRTDVRLPAERANHPTGYAGHRPPAGSGVAAESSIAVNLVALDESLAKLGLVVQDLVNKLHGAGVLSGDIADRQATAQKTAERPVRSEMAGRLFAFRERINGQVATLADLIAIADL